MSTKIELEEELKAVRQECFGTSARHRLIAEDAKVELEPMAKEKDLLQARIKSLKSATDEELREMGYSGRNEADELRRKLEEQYATMRVDFATREAYWREEAAVFEEKNKAANDKKREIEAKIANFKETAPTAQSE